MAHRLSTVQHCDSITVLNHGSVAEQGTHQQLLAKGGLYADMCGPRTGCRGARFRDWDLEGGKRLCPALQALPNHEADIRWLKTVGSVYI